MLDFVNERINLFDWIPKKRVTVIKKYFPNRQLFESSTVQTKEEITTVFQQGVKHWIDQPPQLFPHRTSSIELNDDQEWFSKTIKYLDLDVSLSVWLSNKSQNEDFNQNNDDGKKYDLLITIYARIAMLKLFHHWSDERKERIPFKSFAECSVLVQLLIVLNETRGKTDEKPTPVQSILYGILLNELQPIATKTLSHHEQILEKETPLLFHLQKYLITHVIEYPFIEENKSNYFQFTFQVYELFLKLLAHPQFHTQHLRNILLFPRPLINYLFKIFLLVPTHQEKIFLLHLFIR